MAAAAVCFAGLAASLLGGTNIYSLIPSMPYWCGAILALAFAALTVLSVIGCIYYGSFLRQLVRSFGRFQHNALVSASGEATLPALAINPQFSAKTKRRVGRRVLNKDRCIKRLSVFSEVFHILRMHMRSMAISVFCLNRFLNCLINIGRQS